MSRDSQALVTGIMEDARGQAEEARAEADAAARARLEAARTQAASIRTEAEKKAAEAAEQIRRSAEQTAGVQTRRIDLRVREGVYEWIAAAVTRRLAELIGTPEYRTVLKGWIAEAAVGLDAREAEVIASPREMEFLDEQLLREAEAEVLEVIGKPVALRLSSASPPSVQGVVLTASDGRTAYNNQVPTRLLRNQSHVRRLISQVPQAVG